MTKADLARASMIEYEGQDGDCLLFSTKSWTRPGIVHHLTADFTSGMLTCTCEDGRMHHRAIDILTGDGGGCKHSQAVVKLCQRILEQSEGVDRVPCKHEGNAVQGDDAGEAI